MQGMSVAWDSISMQAIFRLDNFQALLGPEITMALADIGILLKDTAIANTWRVFANPTGTLANTITAWMPSNTEVDVEALVQYDRRREYGFTGMTDSLGRTYKFDPGKPYMHPALDDNRPIIEALMTDAVVAALGRLAP